MDLIWQWDKKLFFYLNGLGGGIWDFFWLYFTKVEHWLSFYFILILLFFHLYGFKKTLYIYFSLSLLLLSLYLSSISLKLLVERIRPCDDPYFLDKIRVLTREFNGKYSFPSTHASMHFAIAIFLGRHLRIYGKYIPILFILWAILISYSRVYIGLHYPLDIFIGAFLGLFFGLLFSYFSKKDFFFFSFLKKT